MNSAVFVCFVCVILLTGSAGCFQFGVSEKHAAKFAVPRRRALYYKKFDIASTLGDAENLQGFSPFENLFETSWFEELNGTDGTMNLM